MTNTAATPLAHVTHVAVTDAAATPLTEIAHIGIADAAAGRRCNGVALITGVNRRNSACEHAEC